MIFFLNSQWMVAGIITNGLRVRYGRFLNTEGPVIATGYRGEEKD